jgi:DNA polymerase IV
VLATARWLLASSMPAIERQGITLLGLSLANLGSAPPLQLGLPFGRHRAPELDLAVDEIRDRYGSTAVTRAVLVGRDPGISMPMLPD